MNHYAVLMRGINVGGKNKILMPHLKSTLEEAGFAQVQTYIQSGNVLLGSDRDAKTVSRTIETLLSSKFDLDSQVVRVAAFDAAQFDKIISQAPQGFGSEAQTYRYNVLFLIDAAPQEVIAQTTTREGIDAAWAGELAVYFRNTVQNASKSHLNRIVQKPIYQSITIRNWNTATKLHQLLRGRSG